MYKVLSGVDFLAVPKNKFSHENSENVYFLIYIFFSSVLVRPRRVNILSRRHTVLALMNTVHIIHWYK